MDALKIISEGSIKAEKPQFNVGDTVRVDVRIKEGERERIQAFEGTVIAKKHGGVAETFTVRRVSYGVGIERVFPINSPFVEKVTVVRKGKVRRAKLFYLRGRTGKAAKVKSDICHWQMHSPYQFHYPNGMHHWKCMQHQTLPHQTES